MQNIKKLDYRNLIINNFLSKKNCKQIIKDLEKFNQHDDLVMGGRKRINKGSKNFEKFIQRSKISNKFYRKLNDKKFFLKIKSTFEKISSEFYALNRKLNFSKTLYGSQKGNKITDIKTDLKKNLVYLDMDFSISTKGYSRGPHRDRDSRLINFLIYLNSLNKKDGAKLNLYNLKNKKINLKKKRFMSEKKLKLIKSLKPMAGKIIFFESAPNSYHSASNFYAKKVKKRYFIYGSYSLNKKVSWKMVNASNK